MDGSVAPAQAGSRCGGKGGSALARPTEHSGLLKCMTCAREARGTTARGHGMCIPSGRGAGARRRLPNSGPVCWPRIGGQARAMTSRHSPADPPTILVDDEPAIREVVARLPDDEGYAVELVADGLAA